MKYLVDTMIVSEPAKPAPNARVLAWLSEQVTYDLTISVLTLGEISRGVAGMADGRRKIALHEWLTRELAGQFEGRILSVDADIADVWGSLTAEGERIGRPLHVVDGLLLATARVHGLTVVTRNVGDFAERGVPVLNPYAT